MVALGGCAQDPTDAVFCFATDPYKTTYTMTKALIKAMGGKGNIVHITGLIIDTNTKLREDAVQKAVDETNGAVKLLQTVADTDLDPTVADQKINALLAAQQGPDRRHHRDCPQLLGGHRQALRSLGDKRIKFIGFDDDQAVLDAIKDGFAFGTYLQNPYGQAYIGAYVLDLLASGPARSRMTRRGSRRRRPRTSSTPVSLKVTADNLATYKDDDEEDGRRHPG